MTERELDRNWKQVTTETAYLVNTGKLSIKKDNYDQVQKEGSILFTLKQPLPVFSQFSTE